MTGQAGALRDRIAGHFQPDLPKRLGVAVSGGSDSLALLVLLNDWRQSGGPELRAVTVDHGLRPEAADEAQQVARHCAKMGIPHDTLTWTGWDGRGNLPDQARRARYRLIADWARSHGVGHVAVGHTADDQAETVLMRLAREAGVDGLSGIPDRRVLEGIVFCRPALRIRREALRDVLRDRGLDWVEDPTNADMRYERVRARAALQALAPLGISTDSLSVVARQMREASKTLNFYASRAALQHVGFQHGDILIARTALNDLPDETARRILTRSLKWVSGAEYGPRGRALTKLLAATRQGRTMALAGCLVSCGKDTVRIAREYKAIANITAQPGEVWDGRWWLLGPDTQGLHVAALGEDGLTRCPDWRGLGLPRRSLLASPAVWCGGTLIAAPLAGLENGWRARLARDEAAYHSSFLSH